MKGAGIFCGNLYVGCGKYPPFHRVWYGGCYVEHPKDDFPKSGKESGGDWKGDLEGIYEKGRMGYCMLTYFQYDLCHFLNMKGRDPTEESKKYYILIIDISPEPLDTFWSRELGTVRGNLTMLRKMGIMVREELGLEDWLPPLGPYPLKEEMLIGLACVNFRVSLRKGRYVGHLQWDSMRKGLMY